MSETMTMREYLNQEDPIKKPRVLLKNEDFIVGRTISLGDEKRTEIFLKAFPEYSYVIINGRGTLKTTDHHGNPKKHSCFHFIGQLEV